MLPLYTDDSTVNVGDPDGPTLTGLLASLLDGSPKSYSVPFYGAPTDTNLVFSSPDLA